MKQLRLGRTDLVTSQVGLGTVELGLDYGIRTDDGHRKPNESAAIRLLHEALDHGIGFFDTAHAYGTSEEIIGKALSGRRDAFTLATKIAPFPSAQLSAQDLRAHVDASIQASLSALRTDCIDLLMLHSATIELLQRIDPIAEALRQWQRRGCVRCLGASVYDDAAAAALQCGAFDCLQIALNALDREAEQTTLPAAAAQDVGIVLRSVLMKGILTPRYHSLPADMDPLRHAVHALDHLADSAGMSLTELAFRYSLHCNAVVLTGTARSQELHDAIRFANQGPLDADLVTAIRAIEVRDRALLKPANWDSATMA